MLGASGTLYVRVCVYVSECKHERVCSSELCSIGGEAHCNVGKKERKRGAREEWSRESKRRERGAERANERGMDGRVDGKEKEKEREQRNALVRHAMLGWNQVRPT